MVQSVVILEGKEAGQPKTKMWLVGVVWAVRKIIFSAQNQGAAGWVCWAKLVQKQIPCCIGMYQG